MPLSKSRTPVSSPRERRGEGDARTPSREACLAVRWSRAQRVDYTIFWHLRREMVGMGRRSSSLRSAPRRGCAGGGVCFAGVTPRAARSAPSGPSLSLVRCPPRFAQGTNQRLVLGLGSRIEDEVCSRERTTQTPSPDTRTRTCQCSTVCPLFQAQRRNGGQKMRRSSAKALLISKSIQWLHDGRRIFGGRA